MESTKGSGMGDCPRPRLSDRTTKGNAGEAALSPLASSSSFVAPSRAGTVTHPAPFVAPSLRRSFASSSSAFTLTELMIVIGLIVLMLVLALPAFNYITGSRSIDGAQNTLSAFLGRARAEAIGLQRVTGVFFYIDPATQRAVATLVIPTDPKAGDVATVDVYLDRMSDTDSIQLPPGVSIQFIDDSSVTAGVRADDGYIGFNTYIASGTTTAAQYGGIILFDSNGRLISLRYGFRCKTDAANTIESSMGTLLRPGIASGTNSDFAPPGNMRSQFGFVMFDTTPFTAAGYTVSDVQVDGPFESPARTTYGTVVTATPDTEEADEETWIDQNSTPMLVNRYNGTLVRGE